MSVSEFVEPAGPEVRTRSTNDPCVEFVELTRAELWGVFDE